MVKIIIINGSATSGKDEVVRMARLSKIHDGGICSISTVETVKQACEFFFGCGVNEKTEKARQFWSDVKDAWSKFNNGPFRSIVSRIEHFTDNSYYFVHCREPEEIRKFVKHYGSDCVTLLVTRPGVGIPGNHADQNVENCYYDYVIRNDYGLEDLKRKVEDFMVWVSNEDPPAPGMDPKPEDAGMDPKPEDVGMDPKPEDVGMDPKPEDAGMEPDHIARDPREFADSESEYYLRAPWPHFAPKPEGA